MSDFGAVYDYALMLESSIPEGDMMKYEAVRPAVLGMTKRQKEEAEKLAAMTPEDRKVAEAEIAKKKEEAMVKFQEDAAKRQQEADAKAQQQAQSQAQQAAAQQQAAQRQQQADDKRK